MDLFSSGANSDPQGAPLADRMRPRSLDEFAGQEHILGPGKLLRRAIETGRTGSLILYGPPGTGKTTLAQIIADASDAVFERVEAVASGVSELREVIRSAQERQDLYGRKTILFIDEIHRFNKAQQDVLLPAVEEGILVLVGATTENPCFEVNQPLLSRSRLVELHPLDEEHIIEIMHRALADDERGLGMYRVDITEDALEHIAGVANGDARRALNALELAVLTTEEDGNGVRHIDLGVAEESMQRRVIQYDKSGDNHYDVISAFIKSMRGSDPDASLYWLARMLEAGEDPRFIARRMVVHASEDVGNADPHALLVATAAADAVEYVGMPEARLALAQAAVYIATAPKSNAVYKGITAALADVRHSRDEPVPVHLRDSSYRGASKLGHGNGYKYPHDYPGNIVDQQYVPGGISGRKYYEPSGNGYEKTIRQRLDTWRKKIKKA